MRHTSRAVRHVVSRVADKAVDRFNEGVDRVMDRVESRTIILGKDLMKKVAGTFILLGGAVFISIALYLYLAQLTGSRPIGLMLVAALLFIVGFFLVKDERRYYER